MRGEVYNEDRNRQLVDYTGLRYGNITPTDIDLVQRDSREPFGVRGAMDFAGKSFVYFEFKMEGAAFLNGQRWHLEATCDVIACVVPCIVILARHTAPLHLKIPAAACVVEKVRIDGEWKIPTRQLTVREAVDAFLNSVDKRRHSEAPPRQELEACLCTACRPIWEAIYPEKVQFALARNKERAA